MRNPCHWKADKKYNVYMKESSDKDKNGNKFVNIYSKFINPSVQIGLIENIYKKVTYYFYFGYTFNK